MDFKVGRIYPPYTKISIQKYPSNQPLGIIDIISLTKVQFQDKNSVVSQNNRIALIVRFRELLKLSKTLSNQRHKMRYGALRQNELLREQLHLVKMAGWTSRSIRC